MIKCLTFAHKLPEDKVVNDPVMPMGQALALKMLLENINLPKFNGEKYVV